MAGTTVVSGPTSGAHPRQHRADRVRLQADDDEILRAEAGWIVTGRQADRHRSP